MDKLNLQMFADDDVETMETVEAESTTEEAPSEEIPEELEGISEDVAREVLSEAQDDSVNAEQDSDNKPVDTQKPEPGQKIPYQRFKQQVDKANDLEAQLAAYRNKFGDINAPAQAAQPPAQPPVQTAPPQPKMQFSPAIMKQIQEAVKQRAMQLTGMTQEDIDSLEYADEDDQRASVWDNAMKFAESDVYAGIRQAQAQRAQEIQRMLQEHEDTVRAFNDYTEKQQADPNFLKIQEYATDAEKGYAAKLSDSDRNVIASAYQRIQRNTASPQDAYLVRQYFEQAKADYYSQSGTPRPAKRNPTQKAHPRSEQINGATSPDGSVSVEQLKDMLMTKEWNDIPERYRNLMLGL